MLLWNFQIGCTKITTGCLNCYAEESFKKYGKNFSTVRKTNNFYSILSKKIYPSGEDIWVCNSSDFFHESGDSWRMEIWKLIKSRQDLKFLIVTKRIERFLQSIPHDWGAGYDNVWVCCTAEDQENADKRLPIFNNLPAKHKMIMVEPMFSKVNLSKYLATGNYKQVVSGGECSNNRTCRTTRWSDVKYLYNQCKQYNVSFVFERTGTKWIKRDDEPNNFYTITSSQSKMVEEAEKLNLNYWNGSSDYIPLPMKISPKGKLNNKNEETKINNENQLKLF